MDNIFTSQQYVDRHGFYLVGNQKFFNKTLALINSTQSKLPVKWVFNNNIYKKIDWSVPINYTLEDLYRLRAQQLREQYDYLVLYFSGGADSANILHAFLKNGIFLDEIVMQYPKNYDQLANSSDQSANNFYSEVPHSAVPILDELKNLLHPKTVIRYQDLAKSAVEVYKKDNWFELLPLGTNIAITGAARQHAQLSDAHILKLCDQEIHVAQILGVDKPLVTFNGDNYYAYFLDSSATHSPPVDLNQLEGYSKFYHCEFFYWTPNMPEIVVKQAQEIKRMAELNPVIKQSVSSHSHLDKMRNVLHPIIYPSYVHIPFQTAKSNVGSIKRPIDKWFWDTASDLVKNNYLEGIKYLDQNIDSLHFNGVDIYSGGLSGIASDFYRL